MQKLKTIKKCQAEAEAEAEAAAAAAAATANHHTTKNAISYLQVSNMN